ncbi:MAG TPA: HD domain-containing protein [Gemmataceae bacterium]|nr:HD domain-containing protein [Gemmataceae bacterium]
MPIAARLWPEWERPLAPFGVAPPAARAAFAALVAAYTKPHRHYHNLTHLEEVFQAIGSLRDEVQDEAAVRLAAWYHDVVHDPRAADNEERSADCAAEALKALGLPEERIGQVGRLIRLTKHHQAGPGDRDGVVLLDADLAILGAPAGRYAEYAGAIRREYDWVPEEQYRRGRKGVLERFLAREWIFGTGRMREEREGQARENLRRELAELTP